MECDQYSVLQVLGVLESLGRLLHSLHKRSQVHRDLKPDNVLFMTHSLSWRLLDLGIVGRSGAHEAVVQDMLA
jgi:serine/threonine protein kinase